MTAIWREVGIIVGSALIGGSGICGIVVYFVKRFIEKKLEAEEKKSSERSEYLKKKAACEERMQHAESRWIFWVNRWIETGSHNGELREAYDEYQKAEREKKELEREIVASFEQKKS